MTKGRVLVLGGLGFAVGAGTLAASVWALPKLPATTFSYDATAPFDVRDVGSETRGGATIRNVTFVNTSGGRRSIRAEGEGRGVHPRRQRAQVCAGTTPDTGSTRTLAGIARSGSRRNSDCRMRVMRTLFTSAFAIVLAAALEAQSQPKMIDLGHPLSATDPSWDGTPVFNRTVTSTVAKDGYATGKFTTEEHFGTHLDAPAHFGGEWTTDRIPVERLMRPGVCINVAGRAGVDDDYRLTLDDVRAFESKAGAIPEGAAVLVATGWDRFWSTPSRYMNVRNGVKHFPGISVEAATYLAKDRKVAAIGIDTASVDYGASAAFETHHVTMPLNVYHIENAANLTALPATGFTVIVAPINVMGGSGGPTRIFAILGVM